LIIVENTIKKRYAYNNNCIIYLHMMGAFRKTLVMLLCPLFQAPVPPSERHQEGNQEVPGRPPRPGEPGNLLVSVQLSLGGRYMSLKKWTEQHNQLLPEDSSMKVTNINHVSKEHHILVHDN
jgi:hypothetical protein